MVNSETIDLIKKYESLHDGDLSMIGLQPKQCPAGIWTIGYGHALRSLDGKRFLNRATDKAEAYKQAGLLSEDQAHALLLSDVKVFEASVAGMVRVKLTDNQAGALVSFAYNVGKVALKNSMLLQRLNNGDFSGAENSFAAWNKATVNGEKVALKGLTLRRKAEKELFLK